MQVLECYEYGDFDKDDKLQKTKLGEISIDDNGTLTFDAMTEEYANKKLYGDKGEILTSDNGKEWFDALRKWSNGYIGFELKRGE